MNAEFYQDWRKIPLALLFRLAVQAHCLRRVVEFFVCPPIVQGKQAGLLYHCPRGRFCLSRPMDACAG